MCSSFENKKCTQCNEGFTVKEGKCVIEEETNSTESETNSAETETTCNVVDCEQCNPSNANACNKCVAGF